MKKLIKSLVRIAILLVFAFAGVIVYRLWDKGELKNIREIDSDQLKALLWEESEVLSSQIKENSHVLGAKLEEEWSRIPWEDYKSKLSLNEDQWLEFKESMDFLKEKPVELKPGEALTSTQEVVDTPSEDTVAKAVSSTREAPEVISKQSGKTVIVPVKDSRTTVTKKKVEVSHQKPEVERHSEPHPFLSKSSKYKKAMATLEEAKSENRQGLGVESSSKKHLKKAVGLYRKCQTDLFSLSEDRKANAAEKKHLEHLLEEIGKQIYWGSKLGTL